MKKTIPITLFLAAACSLSALTQDTTYLNASYQTTSRSGASYYKIKARTDSGWLVSEYWISGIPQSIINYKDDSLHVRQGEYTTYNNKGMHVYHTNYINGKVNGSETYFYETGQLKASGIRRDGDYEGEWVGYFPSGKLAGKANFIHGKEVAGEFFHEDGSPNRDVKEFFHESAYPGGGQEFLHFLNKKLKYPKAAVKNDIQGTVVVQFVVDKDGGVSDLKVIKSVDRSLDEEALRVLGLMSNWEPAMIAGIPIKSYKRQPIIFKF